MGILRNHLQQMKKEMPKEYKRLLKGYRNEDEFIREALGFSEKAIQFNTMLLKGGKTQ